MMTDIEYSMYAVCMISVMLAVESFSLAVYIRKGGLNR